MRVRYTAVGLIVGAIWLSSSNQPLWVHAVRTLAILLVVPAVLTPLIAAIRRRRQATTQTISILRFVSVKAGLVMIALVVTELLRARVTNLDLYLAAWLALTLALGGPAIHHRFLLRRAKVPAVRSAACPRQARRPTNDDTDTIDAASMTVSLSGPGRGSVIRATSPVSGTGACTVPIPRGA
jgi:hypothetical protein